MTVEKSKPIFTQAEIESMAKGEQGGSMALTYAQIMHVFEGKGTQAVAALLIALYRFITTEGRGEQIRAQLVKDTEEDKECGETGRMLLAAFDVAVADRAKDVMKRLKKEAK